MTQYLSYKFRLHPNRAQEAALEHMLGAFCDLYNAALQQRIEAYRRQRRTLHYIDQSAELRAVREAEPSLARYSYSAEQQVLRRLDKAFRAFFRRSHGFPRFRARSRFHAAEFRVSDGLTIRKSGRLGVVGVPGEIKCKWHRPLVGETMSAILTRQGVKWFVVFHVEVPDAVPGEGRMIGIDFGLTSLVALSNGETVPRPDWTKQAAKGLRRRQRAVARARRHSHRRRKKIAALARYHLRFSAKRRDFCHKLTRDLTGRFDRIAIEDLNVKGLARGMHAKHVHDAAWGQIASMLDYKAASAGGLVVRIDPRGTSQICPDCGTIKAKTLSDRMHRCDCGCVLDRDVAAARIVHLRAFGPGTGLRTQSQRDAAQLVREAV